MVSWRKKFIMTYICIDSYYHFIVPHALGLLFTCMHPRWNNGCHNNSHDLKISLNKPWAILFIPTSYYWFLVKYCQERNFPSSVLVYINNTTCILYIYTAWTVLKQLHTVKIPCLIINISFIPLFTEGHNHNMALIQLKCLHHKSQHCLLKCY